MGLRAANRRALKKSLKEFSWRQFRDYHGIRHKKLSFKKRFKLAINILEKEG